MAIGRPIELTPNIATKNISSIATADQTQFTVTGGYRINEIAVYRNGVRLADGRDFTASDGLTVNLVNGATVDDVIEFAVFDSFNIAGTIVSAASSQNLSGDLNVTGNLYAGDFLPEALTVGVATVSTALHVGSALTSNAAGDVETVGIITAGSFSGDGSALTGIANTATIVSTATTTGLLNVTGTTDSTSSTTGSVTIAGGVGIAKNVYIGAGLSVAGTLTYEDVTNVDSVGLITAKSGVNVSGGQLVVGVAFSVGAAGVVTAASYYGDGSNLSNITSTTINSNADNRLITGSGTANTLNGETNLTFDGASLKVGSGITMSVTAGIVTARGLDAAISVWTLGADGSSHYTFTGPGNLSATNDPTLNLIRGQKYTFKNRSGGHPFRIQSTINGSAGTAYNTGVTNNDGGNGTNILFDVPYDAPAVLYYQCTAHPNMGGAMYISGSGYETKIGTGITISATAGVVTFANASADTANTLKFGDNNDLTIRHDGANYGYVECNTGSLFIRGSAGTHIMCANGTYTALYYGGSSKLTTTDDGITISGIATASGAAFSTGDGVLREKCYVVANKLSAFSSSNISLNSGMVWYYTTQETTTSTPNIRFSSGIALNSVMSIGEIIAVTVITTAAAAGYSANWTIDGNAVTEEWIGGSAPSAGGSDGLDIYSLTIIKTADATFKVIANVSNAT